MPNVEIVGVTEIVDKSKVPYIIVRQSLPNGQEKFILNAEEGISFKVKPKGGILYLGLNPNAQTTNGASQLAHKSIKS